MSKVKNYEEYLEKLNIAFRYIDRIPKEETIQSFIDKYDLYADWEIVSSEVKQDIRSIILANNVRYGSQKKKWITSYKEYLEKLRDTFGIPESMPKTSEIKEFIDIYGLLRVWEINEDDVSRDLQNFIDGKFDEMYGESNAVVPNTPRRSPTYTYSRVTNHTSSSTSVDKSWEKVHKTSTQPDIIVKIDKSHESKNPVRKKVAKEKNEKQKTIFLDGDNHLNEAIKGIEQLKKDETFRAVFAQEGAKKNFDKKYGKSPNVSSKLVKPGDQAVDNQIKSEAGQLLKKGNQDVTFISHDKGFEKYRDRKLKEKGGNDISVVKSVREKYSKNGKSPKGKNKKKK